MNDVVYLLPDILPETSNIANELENVFIDCFLIRYSQHC